MKILSLVVLCLLVACGENNASKAPTPDAGPRVATTDAGVMDFGSPDAGSDPLDSSGGPVDAGMDADDVDAAVDMAVAIPPVSVEWPMTPAEFAASARVSYIDTLAFPELGPDDRPVCCRDFGVVSRDDGIDNSFAILAASLDGFGVSLDELLVNTVTSGDLVVLLDHRELDGPDDPDNFALSWLRGSFDGMTDYAAAAAGNGTFLLDPESLHPSGEPKLLFNPALMTGSQMSAGPASLTLLLPVAVQTLDLTVSDASMAGDATLAADAISYTNGTISGWVELEAIFENLNTLVAENCECLGLTTPLFAKNENGDWRGQCQDEPEAVCQEELCVALSGRDINNGGACTLTQQLLPQLADIDIDGDDSEYEAISMGLVWTAVPGTVAGTSN